MTTYQSPYSVAYRKPIYIYSTDPRAQKQELEKYTARAGASVVIQNVPAIQIQEGTAGDYKEPPVYSNLFNYQYFYGDFALNYWLGLFSGINNDAVIAATNDNKICVVGSFSDGNSPFHYCDFTINNNGSFINNGTYSPDNWTKGKDIYISKEDFISTSYVNNSITIYRKSVTGKTIWKNTFTSYSSENERMVATKDNIWIGRIYNPGQSGHIVQINANDGSLVRSIGGESYDICGTDGINVIVYGITDEGFIYIGSIDPQGDLLWARQFTEKNLLWNTNVVSDIYGAEGTIDYIAVALNDPNSTLLMLDSSGNELWAISMVDIEENFDASINSSLIKFDSKGNVYYVYSDIHIPGETGIVCISSKGEFKYARRFSSEHRSFNLSSMAITKDSIIFYYDSGISILPDSYVPANFIAKMPLSGEGLGTYEIGYDYIGQPVEVSYESRDIEFIPSPVVSSLITDVTIVSYPVYPSGSAADLVPLPEETLNKYILDII